MYINKFIGIVVLIFIINISHADQQNITINFDRPEKFTDFKTQINLRAKDREMLMQQLTDLISESATQFIGKQQKMEITIHNMDMAGSFLYGNSDLVRVVREDDRIRFEFTYRLLGANGTVISEDNVNLSSRKLRSVRRELKKYKHTHFSYEMPLFDSWLKKAF